MKKTMRITSAVWFVVLALLAVGCSGKKSDSSGNDDNLNKAERLAIGHNLYYFPVIIAYEKGFLRDELGDSIKIDIPYFSNGPAQNEAIKAGRIDIGNMGDLPTIQLWANDTDIQIISFLSIIKDGNSLVANKQSGIKTLADLKNKKIATQFGSNGHKTALRFLGSQGLNANDVDLVNLQRAESITALKLGVVDATILDVLNLAQTLSENENIIEISKSKNYDNIISVSFVRTEYAQENPKIVSGYLKALKKANDWIAKNNDEAIQIVAKFMNSNDTTGAKLYLESRIWPVAANQELIDILNDTISFCSEQGMITRNDLDAKNLVVDTYIKQAGL